MNYRYKISGEDIIVSEEEDKKINEAIESGGGLVYLRDGRMGINTKFVSFRKETTQMTEEQEAERRNAPKLPEPVYRQPINHEQFFTRMNWDWEKSKLNPKNQAHADR